MPAIVALALPKCPLCLAAYAGALGALGVGRWLDPAWMMPITLGFLLVALALLGFRARRRNGHGPLLIGALGSSALLLGKFATESRALTYAGAALLFGAAVWNAWAPRFRRVTTDDDRLSPPASDNHRSIHHGQ